MEKPCLKLQTKQKQNLISVYRTKKPFGVIDAIIIATLLVAIILCCVFTIPSEKGNEVVIYHKGKEIGRYSLLTDREISILDGKMQIIISENFCFVKESDCKNKVCINIGEISKAGQRIVCTPNEVTILITSKQDVIITGGAI